MNTKQAKDFLVEQATQQAAIDGVPLSDLEKRMMYFTEVEGCPEDPIALNEAFEAEYDTDDYEAKISKLLHHAYHRIKKENPETCLRWAEAMRVLSKGDHYILVFCKDGAPNRPASVFLKFPLLTSIVVGVLVVFVAILIETGSGTPPGGNRYGRYIAPSGTYTLMPLWLQRLLWFLMLSCYLYYVVPPWILKKPLPGPVSALSRLFRREVRRSRRR